MITTIYDEVFIQCAPAVLFDYVTQPRRWHEWHPSSVGASYDKAVLESGDAFNEEIIVKPISPFPLTLKRHTSYKVTLHDRPNAWEVKGVMKDGWLVIHYEFTPEQNGTLFKRTLQFEITGFKKYFLPYLLQPRMKALSTIAMHQLKTKMEKSNA